MLRVLYLLVISFRIEFKMGNKRIKHNLNSEKGQSLLELAVSLIILLILLSGVVDFGRVAFYYLAMRDAAQEGASYASIFPNNCEEIVDRVIAGSVDTNRISVDLEINGAACGTCPTNYDAGQLVEITVSDPDFPITMPLLGAFLGKQSISLETTIYDNIVRVPLCPGS